MRLLLDTHIVLWAVDAFERLTEREARAIRDPENEVYYSVLAFWELSLKAGKGKIRLPEMFLEALRLSRFEGLPLLESHTVRFPEALPRHPDPFDRMLVAQAMEEELTLMTRDRRIAGSGVRVFS